MKKLLSFLALALALPVTAGQATVTEELVIRVPFRADTQANARQLMRRTLKNFCRAHGLPVDADDGDPSLPIAKASAEKFIGNRLKREAREFARRERVGVYEQQQRAADEAELPDEP